jgi:hypothetical protein
MTIEDSSPVFIDSLFCSEHLRCSRSTEELKLPTENKLPHIYPTALYLPRRLPIAPVIPQPRFHPHHFVQLKKPQLAFSPQHAQLQEVKKRMTPSSPKVKFIKLNQVLSDRGNGELYEATYSGVNVYEMTVAGHSVMRRRHDSWINATHILKIAGVEKGKRTKILEREVHHEPHEKIQGGFGKYQGTW